MKLTYLTLAIMGSLFAAVPAAPMYGATKDVVFGSTLSGGTIAKYSHASNSIVFNSPGWGTFEQMIAPDSGLGDADVYAGVTLDGGSVLVLLDTATFQPTTGWGTQGQRAL